jgi:dTDP-4-amino-4,6-dideoxygalactose transaminase
MAKQSTNQGLLNNPVRKLEKDLAKFTRAPYVVATDCCTHAIELCLRLDRVKKLSSTCYTYLSVPMTFVKLGITYEMHEEHWLGEYNFKGTRIWDSARLLHPNMHRKNQLQCLSFGIGKPIDNKRGGAILCNTIQEYTDLKMMGYDGRDPSQLKWAEQKEYRLGFHYNMPFEHAENIRKLLTKYKKKDDHLPRMVSYPDCRSVKIKG